MTSHKFGDFFDPLCQTKIAFLLTTRYRASQKCIPFSPLSVSPNCVTSFMNDPYAKANKYSL